MNTINIHQAKSQLSALIQSVLNGERIVISNNNKPVVELVKFEDTPKANFFGVLKDEIWEADDCWVSEANKTIEDSFYNSKD